MTRINCGIPPADLSDKHLLAEHREIKRIPNVVKSGRYSLEGTPEFFKLGSGHVKFFYTRLGYLLERYNEIYVECVRRGFNVQYYGDAWNGVPENMMGSYTPTEADVEIVMERINFKLFGE
jgi:deoxyribonuclease (pyrimidine dimer)